MGMVREPVVSGTFYPDDPKILADNIRGYLRNAKFERIKGEIVGIVSPHAGYIYSGQVVAYGMKAVSMGSYDTVIVMGSSHREYFEGAAIMDAGRYRTPLGSVDIDEELARAIMDENKLVFSDAEIHGPEHSLEVQIPFLQTVLSGFKLVPMVIGSHEGDICASLARAIYEGIRREGRRRHILLVGSTDLSHYHSYADAMRLDKLVVDRLETFDIQGMMEDFNNEICEACGKGPIIVTMMLSRLLGAGTSKVLKYTNSGDVSGDKGNVVGYMSAVFYRAEGAMA
ncbi:MAG: AmmeMemoRadiSam system protein B [Syntrophobacterales bacterium]|jgi:AmmeMemoRadiSam system protein B|nr:AmmeMemoRadiSam system protein B [Syntrophobacterales bacterium]